MNYSASYSGGESWIAELTLDILERHLTWPRMFTQQPSKYDIVCKKLSHATKERGMLVFQPVTDLSSPVPQKMRQEYAL